jgi:hypothetical protein
MNIIPNPQREWIVVAGIGLSSIAFAVWTSTTLIDQVVSGAFAPETAGAPVNTKPMDEVIRAGSILERLSPPPLEQSEGEG